MRKPHKYWNYETCYKEALKYKSRSEFTTYCDPAYRVALRNKWLDDYVWFVSPMRWTYDTCKEEAMKYSSRSEFAQASSGAYHVACKNNWLDEFTWLPSDARQLRLERHGLWTQEACFEEAKKYKSRTEFAQKNGSAYKNATKHRWIDDYTWLRDERLDIVGGQIDLVYAYEFTTEHAVYVGRTLMKRQKDRDRQHLFKIDSVSSFAKERNIAVPKMKVLESGLTLDEGVLKEAFWIEKYRKEGWTLLNKAKAGSIGMIGKGKTRYSYEVCTELSKECSDRAELKEKFPQAYRIALRKGWLDDFVWLKDGKKVGADKRRKYDRQTCFEEAKKYKTITDFEKGNKGACRAARANGWMKDYTWFTLLWQKKWNKESCYAEAKKCTTLEDFMTRKGSAYATACANKWIDDYDWLQRKRTRRGFWQDYDHCYAEAKKYTKMSDFTSVH